MSNSDFAGLEKALNDPPVDTLLAMADLHEEKGDAPSLDIATGLRWLVKHRKEPAFDPDRICWYWPGFYTHPGRGLPAAVLDKHKKWWGDRPSLVESTRCRAYLTAADAVGRWMRECRESGTPLFTCPRCKQGQKDLHTMGCCERCFQDGWRLAPGINVEWVKHPVPSTAGYDSMITDW